MQRTAAIRYTLTGSIREYCLGELVAESHQILVMRIWSIFLQVITVFQIFLFKKMNQIPRVPLLILPMYCYDDKVIWTHLRTTVWTVQFEPIEKATPQIDLQLGQDFRDSWLCVTWVLRKKQRLAPTATVILVFHRKIPVYQAYFEFWFKIFILRKEFLIQIRERQRVKETVPSTHFKIVSKVVAGTVTWNVR